MKKKLISVLLAVAVVIAYSVPSFAEDGHYVNVSYNIKECVMSCINYLFSELRSGDDNNLQLLDYDNSIENDNQEVCLDDISISDAEELIEEQGYELESFDDNRVILLDEDEEEVVIELTEEDSVIRCEVDSENDIDESGYIEYDKECGIIYSSFTNNAISVDDFIVGNGEKCSDGIELTTIAKTKTVTISYSKLAKVVGKGGNLITIATGIITILAAVTGVVIATGPAGVIALIAMSIAIISEGLSSKSGSHGIIVTLKRVKIVEHHKSQEVSFYAYKIDKVGTY